MRQRAASSRSGATTAKGGAEEGRGATVDLRLPRAHGEMEGRRDEGRLSGFGQRKAKSDASLQRWGVDHRVVVRRQRNRGVR